MSEFAQNVHDLSCPCTSEGLKCESYLRIRAKCFLSGKLFSPLRRRSAMVEPGFEITVSGISPHHLCYVCKKCLPSLRVQQRSVNRYLQRHSRLCCHGSQSLQRLKKTKPGKFGWYGWVWLFLFLMEWSMDFSVHKPHWPQGQKCVRKPIDDECAEQCKFGKKSTATLYADILYCIKYIYITYIFIYTYITHTHTHKVSVTIVFSEG